MNYWSPLAERASTLGLGFVRGELVERYFAPCAVVVHTTGSGPATRATSPKFAVWRSKHRIAYGDALGAALAVYGHIMPASPHYVIGQDGTTVQLVPESHAAHHVGAHNSRAYFTRPADWDRGTKFAWWRARWPGMESPRNLGGGRLWEPPTVPPGLLRLAREGFPIGSCNINTIGIEVVAPVAAPTAPWSAEAWHSLARLVLDVCARYELPVRRDRVISHSDAHPLARTTPAGKPWDPGLAQWSWERLERAFGDFRPEAVA